jgi:hypothetical protein
MNFKNLFWTQFSKLRDCSGSVEMTMSDTTCVACFIKAGSGNEKFTDGQTEW